MHEYIVSRVGAAVMGTTPTVGEVVDVACEYITTSWPEVDMRTLSVMRLGSRRFNVTLANPTTITTRATVISIVTGEHRPPDSPKP